MRRRSFFRGHVQGVGFRATACWVARGFDVAGYVRNRADGSVELVAEGHPDELDRFLEALHSQMGHLIRQTESVEEPSGSESFQGFTIRY